MTRNDWAYELAARIILQAVEDYCDDFYHPAIPDAGAFLTACGLRDENGELDPRLQRRRRGRPTT